MTRRGFTMIELLVAVAIIALLASLLLPAVQSARESGRRGHCANNLRQAGLGLLESHDVYGSFPLGGWGYQWVPVVGRGHGKKQPGGWAYSILPLIEQGHLQRLAAAETISELLGQPIALFTCPSRRQGQSWAVSELHPFMQQLRPWGAVQRASRGDYAINGGATRAEVHSGPNTLAHGDTTFGWPTAAGVPGKPQTAFTGISHIRMAAKLAAILDGSSRTYLVGEKYIAPLQYETGEFLGDNKSLFNGFCADNHRFTELDLTPAADGDIPLDNLRSVFRFGSAHPTGLNMAYCDGAVQFVSYAIEPQTHHLSGNVADFGVAVE